MSEHDWKYVENYDYSFKIVEFGPALVCSKCGQRWFNNEDKCTVEPVEEPLPPLAQGEPV